MVTRVLFATTKNLTSSGVANCLAAATDIELASWITEPDELQEAFNAVMPDCLMIGVNLFGNKTVEKLNVFSIKNPSANILVITSQINKKFIQDVMEAGAKGIVFAPSADYEQLLNAIRCVANDRTFLCRDCTEEILGGLFRQELERTECTELSCREKQIVSLIADGHSSKEIAKLLSISPATIDVHRKNIMRKIGAHKSIEIARYAIKTELVK